MDKSYKPEILEAKWQHEYEKKKIGAPKDSGNPFCIMIPPPNLTGSLHLGHGFQLTLMDTIVRYMRMNGNNTLWQMGTDHAGIATQMVVERQLEAQGLYKQDLGRDKFIDEIWQWIGKSGSKIKSQIKRMGASVDWDSEKFTLDESMSTAVISAFVKLHREGTIYRGSKLVNWDPILQTSVSDLEVVSEEYNGSLWYLKYKVCGQDDFITVATTRPETMFGDTAIAISPDDDRHKHLLNKFVNIPLTSEKIKIIADSHIDPEFGTGFVKVTPAHDFNDYEIGKRHNLTVKNIFTPNACLNENVPAEFRGLDRFEARKKVLQQLDSQGLLEKTESHKMVIPKGEKSGAIIEPYLTPQWFVETKALAKPAVDVVKTGRLKFHPKNWENTYFNWLENIEDWCISRQLWWGHRIPAWYDKSGNVYVGKSETEVRDFYKLDPAIELEQDNDVLDTWFSSALWPFATLGWPDKSVRFDTFFPTNLLVTGFDIIFFWVARMVMFSHKFTGDIPFKDVYVTGLIKDSNGQKMSKSKGNILDPIELIDGATLAELLDSRTSSLMQPEMKKSIIKATKKEFPTGIEPSGTDALRFTFAALATPGRDIKFDAKRLVGYRNFCNKIWNAARYITLNVETTPKQPSSLSLAVNIWLSGKIQDSINEMNKNITSYRFDLYAQTLYELIWDEYCDWYLELTKPILKSKNKEEVEETKYFLFHSLNTILKMAHPLIPFITEEIWSKTQDLAPTKEKGKLLAECALPQASEWKKDKKINKEIVFLKSLITGVRKIRAEMGISPGKVVNIIVVSDSDEDMSLFTKYKQMFKEIAKVSNISTKENISELPASATFVVNQLSLNIPLVDVIDKNSEIKRLTKNISKLEKALESVSGRLKNKNYLANAPENIVKKEKDLHASQLNEITKLKKQLKVLEEI